MKRGGAGETSAAYEVWAKTRTARYSNLTSESKKWWTFGVGNDKAVIAGSCHG
jgi:hypothetical protein